MNIDKQVQIDRLQELLEKLRRENKDLKAKLEASEKMTQIMERAFLNELKE